jgi:hypothetical protein
LLCNEAALQQASQHSDQSESSQHKVIQAQQHEQAPEHGQRAEEANLR